MNESLLVLNEESNVKKSKYLLIKSWSVKGIAYFLFAFLNCVKQSIKRHIITDFKNMKRKIRVITLKNKREYFARQCKS